MTNSFVRSLVSRTTLSLGATRLGVALCCTFALTLACSDDDVEVTPGTGGSSGTGGTAGSGGGAGTGGGGSGGSAGDAGVSGPSGTIQVLSSDPALRGPTTAAVRGNNLWVVNGQLGGLFGGPAPVTPFTVVSVPLAGGPIGSDVINLPGLQFYPEGIAAAADGTLYVGSLNLSTIVRVAADSFATTTFVAAGVAERGVIGLTVDDTRGMLWFCDSNPLAAAPSGAIVGIDLDDGTEVVRHAMPNSGVSAPDAGSLDAGPGDAGTAPVDAGDAGPSPAPGVASFCNDVIVSPSGVIFATDSAGGRVFRVPAASVMTANSAEVWLSVPEIGPPAPGGFGANGLDLLGNELIIANGNLVAVDSTSNNPASTVRVISLTLNGAAATLCGPDGLQTVPGSTTEIVAVENGNCTNPPGGDGDRVVRITLDLD